MHGQQTAHHHSSSRPSVEIAKQRRAQLQPAPRSRRMGFTWEKFGEAVGIPEQGAPVSRICE
jgi:hypothetical protein